jgi:3-hydroxyacyl-[acyl-carrier-protein] dehydratase
MAKWLNSPLAQFLPSGFFGTLANLMASPVPNRELLDKVKAVLRRDLKLGPDAIIADDMPFFSSAVDLDSLDMLLLVGSIEKEFGLRIPNEAVGRQVFENVSTLAFYIQEHMTSAAPPPKPVDPLERLPHREPFRFISRIVELQPGKSGEAIWTLTGSEAFFAGHFPGRPIVPGVLIAEALAQLSGLVGPSEGAGNQGMLAHLDIRFEQPAAPPAEIRLRSQLSRVMGTLQQFEVAAMVGPTTVARGTLALNRPAK